MRTKIIKTKRFYITSLIFIVLLGVVIFPWGTSIKVPAVFKSGSKATLFASAPGYIESNFIRENEYVEANDILLVLRSPKLEHKIDITLKEIEILQLQARRIAASLEELSNVQIIVKQLQESRSRLNGLLEQKNKLVIRAPISGVVYDVHESLHAKRWINKTLPLATVVDPVRATFDGVVSEAQLSRIMLLASAKFIPDNPELDSVWGYVREIESANLQTFDMDEIASVYGGKVPVTMNELQKLVPDKSEYRVRFEMSLVEEAKAEQEIRGVVHVQSDPESYLKRAYKLVAAVFIRESGF